MYLGQATFYHDRMNEFLEVAKCLEIKEISKDVDVDDAGAPKSDGTNDNNFHNDKNFYQLETNIESSNKIEDNKDEETKIIQSHMTESGKFQCSKCDKQFVHSYNLNQHFKRVHEGLSYKCSECEKSFNQKISLITHIRGVHEGVKFPCNECAYKANSLSNLYSHSKNKH